MDADRRAWHRALGAAALKGLRAVGSAAPTAGLLSQTGAQAAPVQPSQAGTAAGRNLAGLGLNVNLASVLDGYDTPGTFMGQYQRSYSDKASVVTGCGEAFITAHQQTGVAATAKHFPGLGLAAGSQDTDSGPVTLNVPLAELPARDEAPYPAAMAGVKLIMVSWAIYPVLDAAHPAGLSPTMVQKEQRNLVP